MQSSGMRRRATLKLTDVSEERTASIIRGGKNQRTRNKEQFLVTGNTVSSSLTVSTLMVEAIHSSETSVLTKAIRRHIS
jgi:hypothetical protein